MKPLFLGFIIVCLFCSCNSEDKPAISIFSASRTTIDLDSLIIYDKDKSWEIKSTLRFSTSAAVTDTIAITQKKIYQIYAFTDGNQSEFGEAILSPNSNIRLSIATEASSEAPTYAGTFEKANNFLAYSTTIQNNLTSLVRQGIDSITLDHTIGESKNRILQASQTFQIADTLEAYSLDKFDHFSDILRKKNEKYLYKSSLISSYGNQFNFKDIDNNTVSLKDFLGRYVYIDVWATWCKPCKVEHKYLEDLETLFTSNTALQILSVSTDKEYDTWKNYVSKTAMGGMQLHSGSETDFVKFYDIGALPRFILLDQEGKIISPDEIRPSNSGIQQKLSQLIGSN